MDSSKVKFVPSELSTKDRHQFLLGSIGPRPIAFVSTVDKDGNYNLAPYSFFNAFSSNPPIVVFSSNRRVKDNSTKDTLENVKTNKGLVINVVNYEIARQMTLTSVEFPAGVSEFVKAGFTPVDAEIVTAPLVKESPINSRGCVPSNEKRQRAAALQNLAEARRASNCAERLGVRCPRTALEDDPMMKWHSTSIDSSETEHSSLLT